MTSEYLRSLSGWELVATAQAGDAAAAFGELYRRYQPELYRYAFSRLREHALAEDLVQDAFLRAFRALPHVRDTGSEVGAWLVTILRNRIFDHHRASARRGEVVGLPDADPAGNDDPARCAIAAADGVRLREPLARLTADERACLIERHVHGVLPAQSRSVREGRSVGAVKAATQRALRRLRADLTTTDRTATSTASTTAPMPAPRSPRVAVSAPQPAGVSAIHTVGGVA
jgi:RNA polymerase sigma-70 factor (ECF subfamily)